MRSEKSENDLNNLKASLPRLPFLKQHSVPCGVATDCTNAGVRMPTQAAWQQQDIGPADDHSCRPREKDCPVSSLSKRHAYFVHDTTKKEEWPASPRSRTNEPKATNFTPRSVDLMGLRVPSGSKSHRTKWALQLRGDERDSGNLPDLGRMVDQGRQKGLNQAGSTDGYGVLALALFHPDIWE